MSTHNNDNNSNQSHDFTSSTCVSVCYQCDTDDVCIPSLTGRIQRIPSLEYLGHIRCKEE